MKFNKNVLLSALPLTLIACGSPTNKIIEDGVERGNNASAEDTFTLYRNSPLDPTLKLHIATFDSIEGYDDRLYNYENCERAITFFENDPVFIGSKFFCENGYFSTN